MDAQHQSTHDREMAGPAGLLLLGALMVWPRFVILGFAVVDSGLMRGAFGGWVAAAAGFVALPWTTLAYATMWSISSNQVTGYEWLAVGVGALLDLWTWSAFRR